MENLPLELVCRIIDFTSDIDPEATRPVTPRQAYLALVCQQWRDIIEQRTFGNIKLKSTELETFANIYGGQLGTQRRAYLHQLVLVLDLPELVRAAASRTDSRTRRASRRQRNNEAFTGALRDLLMTLSSWSYDPARDRAIGFAIHGPSRVSPSDKIVLLAPDTIPQVQRITKLECPNTMIKLGSLPLLASRLPRLQEFRWDLFESEEPLKSVRRRRDRYEFAKHLRLLANSSIRQASFTNNIYPPDNEDIETPSLLLPGLAIDHFSQSLHEFSQLESLSVLDIHEAVISPDLFWPSGNDSANLPFWPNLTIFRVSVNMMAADGGWYFEQNPHVAPEDDDRSSINSNFETMPPTPERVIAEEEARARDTDFSAESDVSSTDSETESQRGMVYDTNHWFRTWPSPKMKVLLQAMARAATCMPKLRVFSAYATLADPKLLDSDFGFLFLSAGDHQDIGYPKLEHEDSSKRRLLWQVPKLWRMSSAVQQLWERTLGKDDTIEYEEWEK